jgi:prepilin-type N-terminal cleavage/methylation domain-containing protein
MKRAGYSLIEILAVLAVAAFFLTTAAMSLSGLQDKIHLHRAAWEVGSRLNYARYKALAEGRPIRVRFSSGGYAVEMYDPDREVWRPDRRGVLDRVAVAANNAPMFHPSGAVSHMATIRLENGRGRYRITVAITGRIKVLKE